VYVSKESLGEDVFALKIKKTLTEKEAWRSWFIIDSRTQSIRLFTQPHLALSNLKPKSLKPDSFLVMRAYHKDDKSQHGYKFNTKTITIGSGDAKKCLQTQNKESKDEIHLVLWQCNDHVNQQWKRDAVEGNYEELCSEVKKEGNRY